MVVFILISSTMSMFSMKVKMEWDSDDVTLVCSVTIFLLCNCKLRAFPLYRQGQRDRLATNSSGGRGSKDVSSSLGSKVSGDIGLRGLSHRTRTLLVLLGLVCLFALLALLGIVALLLQLWLLPYLLELFEVDHLNDGHLNKNPM